MIITDTNTLYRYQLDDYINIIKRKNKEFSLFLIDKSFYFYSFEILNKRLQHLEEVYPSDVLHAVAIKSNNIPQVLQKIVEKGHGLEAASFEEVQLAKEAACPNHKIVFDSPVKTQEEIDYCNSNYKGMYLNANSLSELKRLKDANDLNIGLRINPLSDISSPEIFNVSTQNSKFGVPISLKKEIIEAIINYNNVNGLHIHAGSEISKIEEHAKAIKKVYDLAEEINTIKKGTIQFIDIGGGFPAKTDEGIQASLAPFVDLLNQYCPNLFTNYDIITEYGRFVQSHSAFVLSKIEYVLDYTTPNIALTHVGADLFLREIYSSSPPFHRMFILNNKVEIKKGEYREYDIGGPLCFSGDFLKKNIQLPTINEGDWLLICDCGANTLSMWSSHCSRSQPNVIFIN